MKSFASSFSLAAAALLGFSLAGTTSSSSGARAAGTAGAESTIDDSVRLGQHWFGPELSKEDLEGRVVLIEDWGYK